MKAPIWNPKLNTRVAIQGDFLCITIEKCIGCKMCEIICPMDLWHVIERKAVLNNDYREKCLECGHCYSICKPGAIIFHYPHGGTGVIYTAG